jgi:hypothetical protein
VTLQRTIYIVGLCVLCPSVSFSQGTANIPRMANGKPDFNGIWLKPFVSDMTKTANDPKLQSGPKELPFTAAGRKQWRSYKTSENDFDKTCLPLGHARSMNSAEPLQIIQNAKYIALLYEKGNWFQPIPMDGRQHRDVEPTYFGDTVGHWEGDTAVFESVNFNGQTNLDLVGHPHSDSLRLVQKLRFVDPAHLHYQIMITDPKMYTKPWTNDRTFTLAKDVDIKEYSCEDKRTSGAK